MSFISFSYRVLGLAILLSGIASSGAFGQDEEKVEQRREFQTAYKRQLQSSSSIFASAPNHHITPRQNNISFTAQTKLVDVGVAPSSEAGAKDFDLLDDRLEMTGWSILPLIAFSTKHFGLGFTGEVGAHKINYRSREEASAGDPGSYFEQQSSLSYSGAGIYAFSILGADVLPPWMISTLIVGTRNLSVIHESRGTRDDLLNIPEATRFKYDVNAYDAGLNLTLILGKRFLVFPWINYRTVQLGKIRDRNQSTESSFDDDTELVLSLDRTLVWQSQPSLTYGLDFSIQVNHFDIHLGGVFGYLAQLNSGADRVHDNSINIGIGYDLKGE